MEQKHLFIRCINITSKFPNTIEVSKNKLRYKSNFLKSLYKEFKKNNLENDLLENGKNIRENIELIDNEIFHFSRTLIQEIFCTSYEIQNENFLKLYIDDTSYTPYKIKDEKLEFY